MPSCEQRHLLAGSFGYAWDNGLRIEDEIGYTGHDAQATRRLERLCQRHRRHGQPVYDIPLGDNWKLSLGGGIGAGNARIHVTAIPSAAGGTGDLVSGSQHWPSNVRASPAWPIRCRPDVDLFADYRYRANDIDAQLCRAPSPRWRRCMSAT